ncbi:MAG: bifunctional 5,10-methylene-tetrahydrofolate dehydrogenase/5,10-methylene-tetrahydrofolate cyclohydrolase, partial [Gemmatimonadetes bacterium]|nr:bifunctional 5,10-methylene-tetrahydrofolate dehydrogenase/5,10-methylene-tetrahydrofolate cyclohydrolase [Gemmatimonadota bacterium]
MTARILDGNEIAAGMREEMRREVAGLAARHRLVPGLAVVLAGDDPASLSYVKGKRRACEKIAVRSREHRLPGGVPQEELLELIAALNADETVHGILVQVPLPNGLDESLVLNAVDPGKDVDGLHPVNLGRMLRQEEGFLPCTPHGVVQMLSRSGIEVAGKHVVVVGRSTLVGRPLANMLAQKGPGANATVTVCHTGTRDIGAHTRAADILVAAADRPRIISADMVAEGAVVIDVGVVRVEDSTRRRGHR